MGTSPRLKVPTPFHAHSPNATSDAGRVALRIALTSPLSLSDPRRALDYPNSVVWQQIYEPVFRPTSQGERIEPCLLELPERVGDALLASVVPGKFFSDGTPVDAAAIAKGLSECRPFAQFAKASHQRDRVLLTPHRPHARFAEQLTAMHQVVTRGLQGRLPLGSGPYCFADDSTSERPHLVRNRFARSPGLTDEIVARAFPPVGDDTSAVTQALSRGEVDYCDCLPEAAAAELSAFRRVARLPEATAYLFFNTTAHGLWSRDMRAALVSAIDPRVYSRAVFGTERAQANGILAPIFGPTAVNRQRFAPQRAAAEIGAQRKRTPLRTPMRLLVPAGPRPHTPRVLAGAEALTQMFKRVEVPVEPIVPSSWAEFGRIAESNGYDMALSGWTPDTLVATDTLEALLASTAVPQQNRSVAACANLARFGSIELDQALTTAARSGATSAVNAVLDLVDRLALLVPLTCGSRTVVVRREIALPQGFSVDRPLFLA